MRSTSASSRPIPMVDVTDDDQPPQLPVSSVSACSQSAEGRSEGEAMSQLRRLESKLKFGCIVIAALSRPFRRRAASCDCQATAVPSASSSASTADRPQPSPFAVLSCSPLAAAVHSPSSAAHSAQPTRRSITRCFDPPRPRRRPPRAPAVTRSVAAATAQCRPFTCACRLIAPS